MFPQAVHIQCDQPNPKLNIATHWILSGFLPNWHIGLQLMGLIFDILGSEVPLILAWNQQNLMPSSGAVLCHINHPTVTKALLFMSFMPTLSRPKFPDLNCLNTWHKFSFLSVSVQRAKMSYPRTTFLSKTALKPMTLLDMIWHKLGNEEVKEKMVKEIVAKTNLLVSPSVDINFSSLKPSIKIKTLQIRSRWSP